MSVTVTDLFCGAGGSSLGAEGAGLELVMAANHWQTAIDVHQAHFPVDLPKKDRVKLAGNAVTPPVATWITGRVLQALEAR